VFRSGVEAGGRKVREGKRAGIKTGHLPSSSPEHAR